MFKNLITFYKKIIILFIALFYFNNYYAQCTGCTVTGPTSGNVNVNAGQTVRLQRNLDILE